MIGSSELDIDGLSSEKREEAIIRGG